MVSKRIKQIRCKNIKCRHKFFVVIGDVTPQSIVCPKCGRVTIFIK